MPDQSPEKKGREGKVASFESSVFKMYNEVEKFKKYATGMDEIKVKINIQNSIRTSSIPQCNCSIAEMWRWDLVYLMSTSLLYHPTLFAPYCVYLFPSLFLYIF